MDSFGYDTAVNIQPTMLQWLSSSISTTSLLFQDQWCEDWGKPHGEKSARVLHHLPSPSVYTEACLNHHRKQYSAVGNGLTDSVFSIAFLLDSVIWGYRDVSTQSLLWQSPPHHNAVYPTACSIKVNSAEHPFWEFFGHCLGNTKTFCYTRWVSSTFCLGKLMVDRGHSLFLIHI